MGAVLVGVAVGLYFLYSTTPIERALNRGEWVHILFVGVDEGRTGKPEADAISLLGISPDPEGPVPYFLLSFPPNLLAYRGGEWKSLKDIYRDGGLEALVAAVEAIGEVEVHYYAVVDFAGFVDLVDAVGGVEITVDKPIVYEDQSQDLHIRIDPGVRVLDGEEALKYVRYRGSESEYDRIARQQKFLLALAERVRSRGLRALRGLLELGLSRVDTNLTLWDGLYLARRLRDLPLAAHLFRAVPGRGSSDTEGGGLRPDFVALRKLLTHWEEGERFYTRGELRVVVLNGTGERFLAHRTRALLVARGVRVLRVGWADRTDYPETVIVDLSGDPNKVVALKDALLPGIPIRVVAAGDFSPEDLPTPIPEGTDLILILGRGFVLGD
ncbi:MAG: LCP family protein [Caldiserica bacterium]|nr:LCP family protein [Caldisericota bacterium]